MVWLVSVVVVGLGVGALGRLVVPGPNPMGYVATALVGIAGSVLGAVVGRLVFGPHRYGPAVTLLLAVAGAALVVRLLQHRRRLA